MDRNVDGPASLGLRFAADIPKGYINLCAGPLNYIYIYIAPGSQKAKPRQAEANQAEADIAKLRHWSANQNKPQGTIQAKPNKTKRRHCASPDLYVNILYLYTHTYLCMCV